MMINPKVTVLIPCYNVEAYVEEALENVLAQTYSNLEIMLINDGSTDGTAHLLNRIAAKDPRVVLVTNEHNIGLIKTLNKGLMLASGTYIERFDADDVMSKDRIRKQLDYLAHHPDCQLITSRAMYITRDGHYHSWVNHFYGNTPLVAKFISMFESPFLHPGTFISTELLRKYRYSETEEARHVEDYDLFSRMLADGINTYIMEDEAIQYRRNPASVTSKHHGIQDKNTIRISAGNLLRFGNVSLPEDVHTLLVLRNNHFSSGTFHEAIKQLKLIRDGFIEKNKQALHTAEIRRIKTWVAQRILKLITHAVINGNIATKLYAMLLLPAHPGVFFKARTYQIILNRVRWVISQLRYR